MGVHLGVPPVGFLGPQLSVLLFGKLLQTVQQSPGQSRARLRVEFEGFAFEFLDLHRLILPPASTGQPNGSGAQRRGTAPHALAEEPKLDAKAYHGLIGPCCAASTGAPRFAAASMPPDLFSDRAKYGYDALDRFQWSGELSLSAGER